MGKVKFDCKKSILYLFILSAAAIPLMVCSKCSPLYPFNDWPDINIFFTMGKGLMNGYVPYLDLVDHKGPYLYLAAGIGYLFSHSGFGGYFLLEVISMFFFLLYTRNIVRLYTKGPVLWLLPILCTGIAASKSFVHGGSLEELCLGVFAYAVYSLLSWLRSDEKKPMSQMTLLLNGFWAGVFLWSKFTLLGFYMAWIGVVALGWLRKKQFREFFRSAGIFLAGMLAATIPWLIYFSINGALKEWFEIYLWDNIFGYASWKEFSMIGKIQETFLSVLRFLKDRENRYYSVWIMAGALFYAVFPARIISWKEKISVLFLGLAMGMGLFIGGNLQDYYGLPLAVFCAFGILGAAIILDSPFRWGWKHLKKGAEYLYVLVFGGMLILSAWTGYRLSSNVYLLSVDKSQMPQFRFAERIQKAEDKSVLNYGFLDGGFYTVLEEMPQVRYFCVTNLNPDRMILEQNNYIKDKKTHFIVCWKAYPAEKEELENLPIVTEFYDLVDYVYFYLEADTRTYALYELRDE
ncbi:MAG: hypothetical protein HFH89_07425 [Lachnospiraceae bacterium]|nr:hypothetical protein [uncultured Acetatifactor sp.]MCI8287468.1 hypothetical protein [Lachnospiraceae bacterium]